jgi:hypothetical protein
MRLNATRLRGDLYKILDRVLETGEPAEIERRGRLLKITAMTEPAGVAKLESRPERIVGDPDELVGIGWSEAWRTSASPVQRTRRAATKARK